MRQKMGNMNGPLKEAIDGQKKSRAVNRDLGLLQVRRKESPTCLHVLSQVLDSTESAVVSAEGTPDNTKVVAVELQTPRN